MFAVPRDSPLEGSRIPDFLDRVAQILRRQVLIVPLVEEYATNRHANIEARDSIGRN